MEGVWDRVKADAYGSHIRDTGQFTSEFCPTVVQAGANVTLEYYEDTFHQVVGKAQQLFAYPVNDETVPDKMKVCNFFFKADANKTVNVDHLCASSATSCSARARERCKAIGVIGNFGQSNVEV